MSNSFLTAEELHPAQFRPKWLSAVRYSSVYDWTTRLIVALVFATATFGNVSWIIHALTNGTHQPLDHTLLNMAARGSSALFVALTAATTLTRLAPLRKSAGIGPRVVALLGTFLVCAPAFLPRAELPPIVLAISSLFVIVGMLMSFAVLRWLGRAFSIMPEARRLVTHGPYRVVRHPLYICEEVAVIGVFIQVLSPLAVFIFIMHAVFQVRRMLNEETVLEGTFPEYAEYARRTPRLIPFGRHARPKP